MLPPLLFVVVLSNNRFDDTVACLDSLFKSDYGNFKILLLENISMKKSVEELRSRYPRIQVILLTENLGYAGNNNIGIQSAMEQGADWILVLNNDTIVDPSCLTSLIEIGEQDSRIGILGPTVYHFDEPDVIQSAGGVLGKYWGGIHLGMNELDCGQFKDAREVDWISGCAILVRRRMIEQVGGLDPDYFLYFEETEWCMRAGRAGWRIIHVPHAKIWHKGVKQNYEPKPYVTYYITRNYLFTLAKHKAPLQVRVYALGSILRTLLSWSIKPRWKNKRDHRHAMWRGVVDFLHHRMGPMPS